MALKISYKRRSHGVTWKTGHIYEFKYTAYENDPEPMAIFINAISGTHENTGHEHHYFQLINLSYIPRKDRKRFIKRWKQELTEKGNSVNFTWKRVQREFPYIKFAIRRYFWKPKYYIRNATEIPPQDWEQKVVKTFVKDFSKTLKRNIASRLKKLFSGKRK